MRLTANNEPIGGIRHKKSDNPAILYENPYKTPQLIGTIPIVTKAHVLVLQLPVPLFICEVNSVNALFFTTLEIYIKTVLKNHFFRVCELLM
jgi:hypothetical protein